MSGWPLTAPGFTVSDRYDESTTENKLTTVTASGTAHTKGSWVELDASTSQDASFINVGCSNTAVSGTDTGMLVDIGIGGSGSEVVLIPNILAGWQPTGASANASKQRNSGFPVFIPAGSRLSARCQAVIVSDTVDVGVRLLGSPNSFNQDQWQGGCVVTYGADTGNSRGTVVTSTTPHTKGSWVEITGSTTQPHSALALSAAGHTSMFLSLQGALLDIGFGAAASEQILISNIYLQQINTEQMFIQDSEIGLLNIGRTLPVGTRLAARVQFELDVDEEVSVCLHGVT